MKKLLTVTALLLVFALALSACGSPAELLKPQAEPQIRDMLTALTAGDADSAAALLHPDRADGATDAAIAQMIALLDGREAISCTMVGLNVNTSTGTGGTSRTESGTVHILFDDDTDLQLEYSYVRDKGGEGFSTFQFLVGV